MIQELKEPIQIKVKIHVDDRGALWQIFDQEIDIKRIYIIRNHKAGIIRGIHAHKAETKLYFIVQGAAKFLISRQISTHPFPYILSDKNPSILIIPPNYSHGWISLTDDTILIGMSDKTLEESLNDDYRIDPNVWDTIWKTEAR